jgi:hypothetical protein
LPIAHMTPAVPHAATGTICVPFTIEKGLRKSHSPKNLTRQGPVFLSRIH